MKHLIFFAVLLLSTFAVTAQPTSSQWNAFLIQYRADTAFKGTQLRLLQRQTSWLDPRYFAVSTSADKLQDSVRLLVNNLPTGTGTPTNIAPLQKTLDSLVGQFNTFKQWAINNIDAINQRINTTNSNLGTTNTSIATLASAFEQSQDTLIQQLKDLEAMIEALKKTIPIINITYPQ